MQFWASLHEVATGGTGDLVEAVEQIKDEDSPGGEHGAKEALELAVVHWVQGCIIILVVIVIFDYAH